MWCAVSLWVANFTDGYSRPSQVVAGAKSVGKKTLIIQMCAQRFVNLTDMCFYGPDYSEFDDSGFGACILFVRITLRVRCC
jgi:hypothetical protein